MSLCYLILKMLSKSLKRNSLIDISEGDSILPGACIQKSRCVLPCSFLSFFYYSRDIFFPGQINSISLPFIVKLSQGHFVDLCCG